MTLQGVEGQEMSLGAILLIVLVLILVGAFPAWPYSKGWSCLAVQQGLGYAPSGVIGVFLLILQVLLLSMV